MLVPVLLALSLADWVPARWISNDPKSLELLAETPVNCLLLEAPLWSPAFAVQASARGVVTLGVIRPGGDAAAAARRAAEMKLDGVVLEGGFDEAASQQVRGALQGSKLAVIGLPPRRLLRLDGGPVIGTYQGVWPGVQVTDSGAAEAMPTGGPWINTNSGFLRFLRAATDLPVWIGNLPPAKTVLPVDRYLHAIADAAITNTRWILALDDDFSRRLLAREPKALQDWARIGAHLRFFEEHKDWRALKPHSRFAVIQNPDVRAMLSGGVLDMIAVKHTPVRPVPTTQLDAAALEGARMAVAVDSSTLSSAQKEALKNFTRAGGTLLTGPPGWKLPSPEGDEITLGKSELDKVSDVWQGINSMIGRSNLGVRLFNVSAMLSSLLSGPDGGRVVLHLVNYSNYPVENITAHVLGKYKRARLFAPGSPARDLETYSVEEGTGVDIERVAVCATVVLE